MSLGNGRQPFRSWCCGPRCSSPAKPDLRRAVSQDYLETKRVAFPRFYFVAPADLLDILSKGSNPQAILRWAAVTHSLTGHVCGVHGVDR